MNIKSDPRSSTIHTKKKLYDFVSFYQQNPKECVGKDSKISREKEIYCYLKQLGVCYLKLLVSPNSLLT